MLVPILLRAVPALGPQELAEPASQLVLPIEKSGLRCSCSLCRWEPRLASTVLCVAVYVPVRSPSVWAALRVVLVQHIGDSQRVHSADNWISRAHSVL